MQFPDITYRLVRRDASKLEQSVDLVSELAKVGVSVVEFKASDFYADGLVRFAREPTRANAGDSVRSLIESRIFLVEGAGNSFRQILREHQGMLGEDRRDCVEIVLVENDQELLLALQSGADDALVFPRDGAQLPARLAARQRTAERLFQSMLSERRANAILKLTERLNSSLDYREIFYEVLRQIADVLNVSRASLVLLDEAESQDSLASNLAARTAHVVAASDDRGISRLRIQLERYPEIVEALQTRKPLLILDGKTHPVLDDVRAELPEEGSFTLAIFPILHEDVPLGVLFLRTPALSTTNVQRTGTASIPPNVSPLDLNFCQTAANATAVALRNTQLLADLREETETETQARAVAERKLSSLARLVDFFESADDGFLAFDRSFVLLFSNPKARQILQLPEKDASLRSVFMRLPEVERGRVVDSFRRVRDSGRAERCDLALLSSDGTTRIISCAFASLSEREGAVLCSFRDVTDDREMRRALRKTSNFLESLIEASVDAIIAADLQGNILIFNSAAERFYGYDRAEVLGVKNVRELYAEGGAQEVKRMLKSEELGGRGKLAPVRFEARTRSGDLVPINLSAGTIFDESGKASATVGIFTDLRERLNVEERLAQAQAKLEITEKQALLAELAGTTAHELNQPLTSVLAYIELILRRTEPGPIQENLRTVQREAQRMADIVKKLGKITRYETTAYVGAQRILDLDRSSWRDSSPPAASSTTASAQNDFDHADASIVSSLAHELPSNSPIELPSKSSKDNDVF